MSHYASSINETKRIQNPDEVLRQNGLKGANPRQRAICGLSLSCTPPQCQRGGVEKEKREGEGYHYKYDQLANLPSPPHCSHVPRPHHTGGTVGGPAPIVSKLKHVLHMEQMWFNPTTPSMSEWITIIHNNTVVQQEDYLLTIVEFIFCTNIQKKMGFVHVGADQELSCSGAYILYIRALLWLQVKLQPALWHIRENNAGWGGREGSW